MNSSNLDRRGAVVLSIFVLLSAGMRIVFWDASPAAFGVTALVCLALSCTTPVAASFERSFGGRDSFRSFVAVMGFALLFLCLKYPDLIRPRHQLLEAGMACVLVYLLLSRSRPE